MRVTDILEEIKSTAGSNAKKDILHSHSQNELLKKILQYGMDSFTPFNVVKIPKVRTRLEFPLGESEAWDEFFSILDECAARKVTGNAAIDRVHTCFCSVKYEDESWMRKILKKHLSIGASTKTVNKIFPGLIPTFEVSLAQKFEEKRIIGKRVCVEPKLDGIRCFAIVENGEALLYARSGKLIVNFNDTIGNELREMGDGCYDGELIGKDFVSIMRQAYRKEDVDTSDTHLVLFDFLPLDEWKSRNSVMSCEKRYLELTTRTGMNFPLRFVRIISSRHIVQSDYKIIKELHDGFVEKGFEGAMVKDLDAPYKFGRGYEVMKMKVFHDVDLPIDFLEEGTGKHVGKLGSVRVNFNGVDVHIGSGFTDEDRELIWEDPKSFVGRVMEIRYQEVTPDGSLRFPTFVCFRNDR